ncbi:enoyl-CoA hydratase/isomerase family protein [Noviherbaspirillum sedimenti]|uniref:Enoyl-CoA hydratase/isomerase family protein n=1 Tax=Noviherbaspirillum sedimenti TaxID=2320865 RepID=A0A3A3FY44_9BURK|nr:enoyl-CoA hydratase/isomerase family protein [Noviherbaspirillum sedimenti]RJG00644.1 enoyl-CoA hydratase/isomerase family protein [Noviherbaspirillum sedimenti]
MNGERQRIAIRRESDVLVLMLDRPDARNALDPDTVQELGRWIREPGEGVHAIVITGSPPVFCAGGDLAYLRDVMTQDAIQAADSIYKNFHALVRTMLSSKIPLIAAVNGPALGAGLDLALACDLRIAAANATFASTWIRLGLATGMGGSWLLARAIGGGRAAEMLLLGEPITAERAEQIGLVNRVVPYEHGLLEEAIAMAKKLAALPPRAVSATRASLRRAVDMGFDMELQMLGVVQGTLFASEDFAKAADKFLKPRT